jgi:hypothetical protein
MAAARLAVGLLAFLSLACRPQYDLRPTFAPARTYEETTEVRVETTGANVGTRTEQLRWTVARTVLGGGRVGEAPLSWLERVSHVVVGERGRRILHWDSGSGLPPPDDYAAWAALASLSAEIQVSPRGEVTVGELRFNAAAMARRGWSDGLVAVMRRSVGKERLAQAARDLLRRLPARPVRMGDTWATEWALLGLGARWTWQLVAVSADAAKLRIVGAAASGPSAGLEVRRATGEAEVELATGVIRTLQLGLTIRQPLGDVVLEHTGALTLSTRVR